MSLEALVEAVVELAQVPAPTFHEEPRLRWIEARLEGAPGRRRRDEAGNLIWSWGEGRPRLLLLVHVDTVFAEGTELRVRRDGDELVGPGIGDNAAAVAAAIDCVSELLAAGAPAPGAVAFTVGEEGLGNLRGAQAACAALAPEAAIALEGHGLDRVLVDAVGSLRARVRITGPGGHSWVDRGRPSAIHSLLQVGAELAARATPETPVNIGLVSGGRSVNAIADAAELTVELRAVSEQPLNAFARRLSRLSAPPPLAVEVELLGRRPAARLDRGSPLLAAVREVRRGLGLADALGAGSTDANAALALGIPALALGVSRGAGMHSLQERIDASSLALGRAQLAGVLGRLL